MLGVVDESGQKLKRATSKLGEPIRTYPLTIDGANQSVYPWPRREKLDSALQAVKQAAHDAKVLARIGRHLQQQYPKVREGEDDNPPQIESAVQAAPPGFGGELIDQTQLQLKCAEARQAELKVVALRAAMDVTKDALQRLTHARRPIHGPSDQPPPEALPDEPQGVLEERLEAQTAALGPAVAAANVAAAVAMEMVEVASKAALAASNAMLVEVATLQSARLKAAVEALPEVTWLRDATHAAGSKSHRALADVTGLMAAARALKNSVGLLDLDALAAEGLRVKGGLGLRRYGAEQPLMVFQSKEGSAARGQWVDCAVSHALPTGGHVLLLPSSAGGEPIKLTLKLTPWNHAPRFVGRAAIEPLRLGYLQTVLQSLLMEGGGSNSRGAEGGSQAAGLSLALGVRLELLSIRVIPCADNRALKDPHKFLGAAQTVGALSEWLHARHAAWCTSEADTPQEADHNVLLTAGVGGGKTLAVHTLATLAAQRTQGDAGPNLVPIVISVAQLARWLDEDSAAFGRAWNFVDAYVAKEHGVRSETYMMLRQVMLARRALLLIDGLDEGGTIVGDRIRRHVGEVLAQQGHLMVVTARSADFGRTKGSAAAASGVGEAVLATFQHVSLRPCTEALQIEMMVQGGLSEEQALSLITAFRSVWPASPFDAQSLSTKVVPPALVPPAVAPAQFRYQESTRSILVPPQSPSAPSAPPAPSAAAAAAGAVVAPDERVVAGAVVVPELRVDDEARSPQRVDDEARSPQRVDDEARSPQRVNDEARSLLSTPLLLTTVIAMVQRHAGRMEPRHSPESPQRQAASPPSPRPGGGPDHHRQGGPGPLASRKHRVVSTGDARHYDAHDTEPRWPTLVEVLERAAAPRLSSAVRPSNATVSSAVCPSSVTAVRLSNARDCRDLPRSHELESSTPSVRPSIVRQQGGREQGEGDDQFEPAALTTRLLGHAFLIAQLGQSRAEAGKQLQEVAEQHRASFERRGERMEPDSSSSSSSSSSTVVRVEHLQLACRLLVKHAGAPAAGVAESLRWVVGCAQHAQLPTRLPRCMQMLTTAPSLHRCALHAQLPTKLPVLSLQQAQPLELTASHPALQSLLIAQAVGHGTLVSHLPELLNGRVAPPWQWGPQWAGTLLLGATLGRPFSENLLRLGQVEAGPLPTCLLGDRCTLELPASHRPTALHALARMLSACVVGRLRDNRLSDADVAVLAMPMAAPDYGLVSLDLRGNALGAIGGRTLGTALRLNGTLAELRIDSDFALPIFPLKG